MARKLTRVEEGSRRLVKGDEGLCRLEELGSCGRRLRKGSEGLPRFKGGECGFQVGGKTFGSLVEEACMDRWR